MPIRKRLVLPCALLLLAAACGDDPGAPVGDDDPAPLLEGAWTLRVDHDGPFDAFEIPGDFSVRGDSLDFTTVQATSSSLPAGRRLDTIIEWSTGERRTRLEAALDVAPGGGSLTGTFVGVHGPGKAVGDDMTGTIFGVPGDAVPRLAVHVSPDTMTVSRQARVQMSAIVDGWTDNAVTWRVEPEGAGSIDDRGFYNAPWTPPDPPVVSIIATSRTDVGARDTARITIDAPPPDCGDLEGAWTVRILMPGLGPDGEDVWEHHTWYVGQSHCAAVLSDRSYQVDLTVDGSYATGRIDFAFAYWEYWIYDLHFDATTIRTGSVIRQYSREDPDTPVLHAVEGVRLH